MKYNPYREDRLAALRIIAIYALFAALWIYLSDNILGLIVRDPDIMVRIAVFKGFLFIAVTAALLYKLIVRYIRKTGESEKRYRSLFENMQEGYAHCSMLYDNQGRPMDFIYLDVNQAFEDLTGLTDVVGKRVTEVIPGLIEATPEILEIYGRIALSGTPEKFEFDFKTMRKWFFISVFSPEPGRFVTVFDNITERKMAEKTLRESEARFRTLFEGMSQGVFYQGADGVLIDANPAALRMFGLSREEFLGRHSEDSQWDVIREDGSPFPIAEHPSVVALKEGKEVHDEVAGVFNPQTGEYHWMIINATPQFQPGETTAYQVFVTMHDITERKRAEKARETTIELLQICNQEISTRELMRKLTGFFRKITGSEAVGVRLREGEDFPYYETRGFPEEFVMAENSLCAYDQKGELNRDSVGHPLYDCMCGNIICGRFDPAQPFFTNRGSFWSSCTTDLLEATTEADRQSRTRNRCNGAGYESVALVPLRIHNETFGLFQFNDRRRGLFTREKIGLLEELIAYVAISLAKLMADEALLESDQFGRQIINSAEEGIIVYDRDMRYRVWNPFMERLTGTAASEMLGRHPLEIFPFLEETAVIDNIRKALSGQPLNSTDFPFQSPQTGISCWISDTCVPL
ncbi:MAG TPA: PAS domain S-box protein, partial [Geobacteraceae bacterium]|nr:PAS domain S-box protein [Geobacteraceae bacterium]